MEIPHRGPRPTVLPEIYVHESNMNHVRAATRSKSYHSNSSSPSSAIAMSIPHARDPVPPPLPPPKHLADIASGGNNGPDLAWRFGNSHGSTSDWSGSFSSIPASSSLHGSFGGNRKMLDKRPDHSRRTSSTSTIKSIGGDGRDQEYPKDEGYSSFSGTSYGSYKSKNSESSSMLPSFQSFQSSVHDKFQANGQAYDKSLLQKLDVRRGIENKTPPRTYSKSTFSSSASDSSPTSRTTLDHVQPSQLKPLSLPILSSKSGYVESPVEFSKLGDIPLSSGTSPRHPYPRFSIQTQFEHKSPSDTAESDRSPHPYIRRSGSNSMMSLDDSASIMSQSRGESYDPRISPDQDEDFHMEDAGFRRLHIEDARPDAYSPGTTTGQKRRASSPPIDDGPSLHSVGSASDLFRRRESGSRSSPIPRYHSTSASISSSTSGPRPNSYASSTLSIAASSITSMSSFGRLSPGGLSPGGVSPGASDTMDPQFVTSTSLTPSPHASLGSAQHQRHLSENRPLMTSRQQPDSLGHAKSNSAPKVQGVFMCECCPKKPKKFDTQEELNSHEQEKQYECAYCRNRFKNKNEAERHQNSLHLRRHSWSCAALSGYAAAFHTSPTRPNEADTCGYCGEDFPRSGISSPSAGPPMAIVTDQDWDARIAHLQDMHKFGECNHAKKFFRADHFRQHLKHSHAGTSGKWTNMLENACMKDEPLPEPIRGPQRVSPGNGSVGRINEEDEIL